MVPFARVRARVQQFLRVDAGSWRARDVADVVRTRAFGCEAKIDDLIDQCGAVSGRYFTDLQVRARRHVRVTAAAPFGDSGNAGKLPALRIPFAILSRHMKKSCAGAT